MLYFVCVWDWGLVEKMWLTLDFNFCETVLQEPLGDPIGLQPDGFLPAYISHNTCRLYDLLGFLLTTPKKSKYIPMNDLIL